MKQFLTTTLALLMAVAMQGQVTFTAADWAQAQSLTDGATVTSYTSGNVTVSYAQGTAESAPSWNASQSAVAAVSGNTMTISAADGKVVTQAVLTMYRDAQATNLAGASWNTGNASASGTTVTWAGEAEEVTVTINNTARFVSFSLTLTDAQEEEPPFVEDESKYNDTIEVSFAEWIDVEGFSNGEGIDGESYTKDGAQITVAKGDNRTAPEVVVDEGSRLLFRNGNTLTVKAPYMMHKILLHFTSATQAGYFLNGRPDRDYPAASGTTGAFYADENVETNVLWLGSAAELTITYGYNNYVTGLTIIGDNTATGATVTFLGLNGEDLGSQTVAFGGSATAPALPTTSEVGYIIRWDKDFSNVQGDLTVRAVKALAVHLDLTPVECATLKVKAKNSLSITSGGATIVFSGDRASEATEWAESEGKVVIFAGNTIAISATETFRTVRFTCLDNDDAQRVAGSICSSGTISVSGNAATWKGATTSLTLTTTSWNNEVGVTRFEVLSSLAPTLVTFLDKDGNVLKTDTVKNGTATAPEAPAVTGYVFSGWSVPFTNVTADITTQALYTLDPNYAEVTFTDLYGKVLEKQLVQIGGTAVAPTPPTFAFYQFTGWSAPLTNIQTSQTIQAQYQFVFDPNDPNILSVTEVRAIYGQATGGGKTKSELIVVRGIVTYGPENINNGKLSFKIDDVGYERDENLQVSELLNIEQKPFTSKKQIITLDTVYIVGYVEQDWDGIRLVDGYLAYILRATYSDDAIYIDIPDAATMYDFSGNGLKQILDIYSRTTYDTHLSIWETGDISASFGGLDSIGGVTIFDTRNRSFSTTPMYIQDMNHDGKPEVSTSDIVMLSGANGYTLLDTALAVTNMDINRDGRMDYLRLDQSRYMANRQTAYYGAVGYQLPDRSFQEQRMQVFTWDEFVAQMTPEEYDQYTNPQDYSLGEVSRYTYVGTWGGAALARSPRRNAPGVKKAPGLGSMIPAPTKMIDLNKDGLMDLIDEKSGVIYTNMDNGKWVWTSTNGAVIPADLNNDGITDFIFPGEKLYTVIYNKNTNQLVQTLLYQNAASDNLVHCYDFDQDGDVDILATFSAENNATGYAYTCFFKNNGNGAFIKQPEQNYGANSLAFVGLQDLNGDGIYDLLAYRASTDNQYDLVWLQGQNGMSFNTTPFLLASDVIRRESYWDSSRQPFTDYPVSAEDLDNDGKLEIWISGRNEGVTEFYPLPDNMTVTANTRPSAPAAPTLSYTDGSLTITWGNGVDDKTATADLTYALRIGTTAGGNDILAAHALADGTRRNFLDGNMGKEHAYTIDLTSYTPATIYVAVQAIDAQHAGSVWSQEATVVHDLVPVDFTLDRNTINLNETAVLTFTALPEGYTHAWTVQDGSYVQSPESATKLILSFTSGGEKTITHTITAPDNSTASATATITVLPAGVGEPLTINNEEREYIFDAPVADYNFDGRLDGIKRSSYSSGTYASMVVMEGVTTDQLFTQAAGLWNTNILPSTVQADGASYIRWYDWNRDGTLDLLFKTGNSWGGTYHVLYHDATQPTLTARQEDDNLVYLFDYNRSGASPEDEYSGQSFYSDMTHNGLYDNLMMNPVDHYQLIELDGNGGTEWKQFSVTGDADLFLKNIHIQYRRMLADFNHDGWTDIAIMGTGTTTSYGNILTYGNLSVFLNKGGAAFEQQTIPFAQELKTSILYSCADLNGDGYLDLIVRPTNTSSSDEDQEPDYLAVMWNNANQSFSAPQKMPNSEALNYSYETLSNLIDLDNNGYPDLVAAVKNPAAGENHTGTYVWYMGAEGLLTHGFIIPDASEYGGSVQPVDVAAGDRRLLVNGAQLYPIVAQADERPAAPTGLQAQMTEEGLLLTWNAAVDDHTPAALMRYNLAVKQQGAATWLISPQNRLNTTAAYLPDYDYIDATQFLIPMSYLYAGNYEICLQALDRQNQLSFFSQTVTVPVTRNPIEVPSFVCANEDVTVTYRGSETTGTPVWNFGGAVTKSGSGFGPYTVYWLSGGEKTVTLTLNGQTYTQNVTVDNLKSIEVSIPTVLYEETPASASVPEGIEYQWFASIASIDDGALYPINQYGIVLPTTTVFANYDKRLTAQGLNVTAHYVRNATDKTLVGEEVRLYLKVTNANYCEHYFYSDVTVLASTNIPTLTLVTTDANGHNIINWNNADAFASVNVYKEGNSLNDFQLIGSAAASAGTYTDNVSDASQKAERYRLTGVTADGNESPESAIHKTVHLTINRGVQSGTYNLIWNEYAGATVSSYIILRGATPTSLTSIATVAASNTSYTDQTPDDNLPYYAIEYILSAPASAPGKAKAPANGISGRSNVVDRRNAEQGIEELPVGKDGVYKVLIDGQIYILRGDNIYTLDGQLVR